MALLCNVKHLLILPCLINCKYKTLPTWTTLNFGPAFGDAEEENKQSYRSDHLCD